MGCDFCDGTNRVARLRECGSVIDMVNCPKCILGIQILGPHWMLRDSRGGIHMPGENLWTETYGGAGTFMNGIIRSESS